MSPEADKISQTIPSEQAVSDIQNYLSLFEEKKEWLRQTTGRGDWEIVGYLCDVNKSGIFHRNELSLGNFHPVYQSGNGTEPLLITLGGSDFNQRFEMIKKDGSFYVGWEGYPIFHASGKISNAARYFERRDSKDATRLLGGEYKSIISPDEDGVFISGEAAGVLTNCLNNPEYPRQSINIRDAFNKACGRKS